MITIDQTLIFSVATLPNPIEIFYPGKQTASDGRRLSFSAEQVAKWAVGGQRIPLVPGHPKDDLPALGYATGFQYANGRLRVTEVEDLDPAFEAVVNSGQLNRVSVKLRPSGKDWELAHIGFLGTSAPSLGDLRPAQFSTNNNEVIILAEESRDAEFAADLAAREINLADREAEFAAKEAAFAAHQKWSPVVAKLAAEGKILPVEEAPLVACFAALDGGDEIEFSRDGKPESANPAEFIKTILERRPAVVPYGEFANGEKAPTAASFAAPKGYEADRGSLEMHQKAVTYCKANKMDPDKQADYMKALEEVA